MLHTNLTGGDDQPTSRITAKARVEFFALDISGSSSKLKKAEKAGVKIMTLDDWLSSPENAAEQAEDKEDDGELPLSSSEAQTPEKEEKKKKDDDSDKDDFNDLPLFNF